MKNFEYLSGIADVYSANEIKELGIPEGLGKPSVNKKSVYEIVNDYFINEINKGVIPWRKTWIDNVVAGSSTQLMNYRSKRPYTGVNPWLISSKLKPHHCNYFLTQAQIEAKGGTLKRGATKFMVVYFGTAVKTINEPPTKQNPNGTTLSRIIRFLKEYTVYNLADTDLEWQKNLPAPLTKEERLDNCEKVYKLMPKAPPLYHKEQRAYYVPSADYVNMPKYSSFRKPQEYYCTLFHELIHSTGHAKRLKRDMGGTFGNNKYAFEELIAEIGASYICAYTGILFYTRKNSAAYLQSWMKSLVSEAKSNKTFFFEAASKSQKAANFILSKQLKLNKTTKKKNGKKNLTGIGSAKVVQFKTDVVKPKKSVKSGQPVQTVVTKSPELTDIEKYLNLHNNEIAYTPLFILSKTIAKRINDGTYTSHLDTLKEISNRLDKAIESMKKSGLKKVKPSIDLAMIDRCKKVLSTAKVVLRTDYLAGAKKDYYLTKDNLIDFLFDIEDALEFSFGQYKYSIEIIGEKRVVFRVSDHFPNWSNFNMDVYEREVVGVFNVTVGNYEKSDYKRNQSTKDAFKNEFPQIIVVDLFIGDGASLKESIELIKKEYKTFSALIKDKWKPTKPASKKKAVTASLSGVELMQDIPKPNLTEVINEAFGWTQPVKPVNHFEKPNVATKSDSLFKPITHIETRETFNLKGDLGKFLGNLERYELSMTVEGDQGAGKTQFAFQLADAFAQAGYDVGFFSLEIGAGSDIIKRNRDKYLSPAGLKKVLIAGHAPKGIDTIREYAKKFGVIIIDSFTKLNADSREFDKLRKDFPETIWIVLFQRTSGGTIRGGTAPLFDAGINIEVVKEDETFLNNYAVATKNRYGMTGLKFNISQQKIV